MDWKSLEGDLAKVAPVLGGLIGGPAGAGIGSLLSAALGVANTPSDVQQALLTNPDAAVKIKQIESQVTIAQISAASQLQLAQIETNKAEASNINWFIAGWRPFVGWVGGLGLAYAAIIEPLLRFIFVQIGYHGTFPVIDTSITMQVLTGLLGLGAMRTYEKKTGTEGNR